MVPLENNIQGLRSGSLDVPEVFAALTWGVDSPKYLATRMNPRNT